MQDLVKCQLQRQSQLAAIGQPVEYTSFPDAVSKMMRLRGPAFLAQGLEATIYRNIVGVGAYFGFYEGVKMALVGDAKRAATPLEVLTAGGTGGLFYWVLCQPLDVIKSKIQSDMVLPEQRAFRSFTHCAKTIWAEEGYQGFLRGFGPSLLRSIPANAVGFLLFEETKKLLQRS